MPNAGDKVRASDIDTASDALPQGVLALASSTSAVGPTSGTTELDVLTAAAVTPIAANRRLRLRWSCRGIQGTVTNDVFLMQIKEGATQLKDQRNVVIATGVPFASGGCDFEAFVDNPSVAAHTYKVTITRNSGTGTGTVSATATSPMTFAVEDVGPAV